MYHRSVCNKMSRSCGGCVKCCHTMGVKELNKPINVWCPSCTIGSGCQIYAIRPQSCQDFSCLWLQDEEMPEEYRPDRSKVVLSLNSNQSAIVAYLAPEYEASLPASAIGRFLRRVADDTMPVILCIGDKRRIWTTNKHVTFEEELLTGESIRFVADDKSDELIQLKT